MCWLRLFELVRMVLCSRAQLERRCLHAQAKRVLFHSLSYGTLFSISTTLTLPGSLRDQVGCVCLWSAGLVAGQRALCPCVISQQRYISAVMSQAGTNVSVGFGARERACLCLSRPG